MPPPSPATAIAVAALVVALGGAGYAAVTIPRNSVGAPQIKKNAVNSSKVRNGSLLAADFRAGQLPRGERGAQGETGARGPSDAYIGTRNPSPFLPLTGTLAPVATTPTLPAGSYVLSGRANIIAAGGAPVVLCSMADDALQGLELPSGEVFPVAMSSAQVLSAPGTISIQCMKTGGSGSASVAQAGIVATRVQTLTSSTSG